MLNSLARNINKEAHLSAGCRAATAFPKRLAVPIPPEYHLRRATGTARTDGKLDGTFSIGTEYWQHPLWTAAGCFT